MTAGRRKGEAGQLLLSLCVCDMWRANIVFRCVRLYNARHYGKGGSADSNAQWDKVRQADRWIDKWMDSWTATQLLKCHSYCLPRQVIAVCASFNSSFLSALYPLLFTTLHTARHCCSNSCYVNWPIAYPAAAATVAQHTEKNQLQSWGGRKTGESVY